MARDKLDIVLSLRRRSVEQARYALGDCLAAESAVAGQIAALDAAARRDRDTRRAWSDSHQFQEMTLLRQQAARAERQAIMEDLATAETRSNEARAAVSAARSAAEAVEQWIGERQATAQAEQARRDQHTLDDIVRAIRRRNEQA